MTDTTTTDTQVIVTPDDVLDALYVMRIATTQDVGDLVMWRRRDNVHGDHAVARRQGAWEFLSSLFKRGLVDKATIGRQTKAGRWPTKETRWWLTGGGYIYAEAMGRVTARPYRFDAKHGRGNWDHAFAANRVHIALANAARARRDRCGPLDVQREVAHPLVTAPARGRLRDWVITDAVARYDRADGAHHVRFIEVDLGNETLGDLVGTKLARYARLAKVKVEHDLAWQRAYPLGRDPRMPKLIVVFAPGSKMPTRASMEARMASTIRLMDADGIDLDVSFTILADLAQYGPWAPIFRRPGDDARLVNWLGQP